MSNFQLHPGQEVNFFRSHDKQHALRGTIVAVQKNGNMVRIKTKPGPGEVSRVEETHCNDVTPLSAVGSSAARASAPAEWDEGKKADPAPKPDPTPDPAK